jgi:lysyl-tRNA synthetase class 2
VDTPQLAPFLIPEPSLEVFQTEYLDAEQTRPLYLIPSPEIWMKRLIALGAGSLFQIARAFRNGETIGRLHNPEFLLLEWYTVGSDYRDSIEVLEDLLCLLWNELNGSKARPFPVPLPRMSMRDAFRDFAGTDLDALLEKERLIQAVEERSLAVDPEDTWEQLFNKLFLTSVEPYLPQAVVLQDYPSAVPTLAKSDGGYAERWELYIDGVEIANCYTEETRRGKVEEFIKEEAQRKRRCRVVHEIDWDLPGIFGKGFPPCSGTALGMDRLLMVLLGCTSIEQVMVFPFTRVRCRRGSFCCLRANPISLPRGSSLIQARDPPL